jgi:putative sigma-54 modulation protein
MPVRVIFNVRNMELTDRLKQYAEARVSKLDRYLDVLEEATVDLSHAASARSAEDRQVAQLTVRGKGVLMRAEERSADMFASVDSVLAKINRQIERFKGKRWRARGDGRTIADVLSEEHALDEAEEKELVVRRKRFLLMPMSEGEAIEQMSLLDHEDFFIFMNDETSEVNVLYRRRDGSLGLIESEIA